MSSASRAGMELLDDGELHELNLKKFLKLVHQQPQEFERMIKGLEGSTVTSQQLKASRCMSQRAARCFQAALLRLASRKSFVFEGHGESVEGQRQQDSMT
eukprot:CAMPEP_0181413398 /NCGR_PEP_ID=MMETSP1110-20121109/8954_1 /TAXON_ID=174948 /ORGANISM="Symbiodinium sp., Strain CCMP421" /LENGTH=99 /DNA_ID=CAMNT_0023536215 /DNA_START=46 /DNA_END=343 /DNA_ORIENTATION=+